MPFNHVAVIFSNIVLPFLGSDKPCETLRMRVEKAILEAADIGTNRLGVQNVSLICSNQSYAIVDL